MIAKKSKTILLGLSGLLPIVLGGCVSPETVKPSVQKATAKPGTTYVIRRAAIHTPATDKAWRERQVAQSRRLATQRAKAAASKQAAKSTTPQNVNRKTSAAKTPAKHQLSRAQYQARFKAQQLATKRRQLAAAKNKASAAQASRTQQEKHKAHLAQQKVRQAQWKKEQARLAQQKTKQQAAAKMAQKAADTKRQYYLARWEKQQAEKKLAAKKAEVRVERVIHNAKKQIGGKYVWGGASPKTGFDCSGLVQHSMKTGANVKVPRTAAAQYKAAVKVPAQKATRGDLIFFRTRGKSVSHVGIYLGDDKFVHAPRTGRRITTSKLAGYWKQRFVGFGRVPGACKVPV